MNYKGTIIEESLEDKEILKEINIVKTKVEKVTESHKTPWIKQWTLHEVIIEENKATDIANKISKFLDSKHNWYADFKNENKHFIIFKNKVFHINRTKEEYNKVKEYGIKLGIPEYQLDFSEDITI